MDDMFGAVIKTCDEAVLIRRLFDPTELRIPTIVTDRGEELLIYWTSMWLGEGDST